MENGTPQGSVIGSLIFSTVITEVFSEIDKSLFANDGAVWKNIQFIRKKFQRAVRVDEEWSYRWGFPGKKRFQ